MKKKRIKHCEKIDFFVDLFDYVIDLVVFLRPSGALRVCKGQGDVWHLMALQVENIDGSSCITDSSLISS